MPESTLREAFATRENFLKLESLEKKVAELKEEADAVEECGIDCQVFRTIAAEFTRQLANYRNRFFNPPPEM